MALVILMMMLMMKMIEVLMVKVQGQWDRAIRVSHHSLKMPPQAPLIMLMMMTMIMIMVLVVTFNTFQKYYSVQTFDSKVPPIKVPLS